MIETTPLNHLSPSEAALNAQATQLEELLPRILRRLFTLEPDHPVAEMPVAQLRACSILRSLRVAALVVGPPEGRDFPLLLHPDPWPCLAEGYQRGTYRVYRLVP